MAGTSIGEAEVIDTLPQEVGKRSITEMAGYRLLETIKRQSIGN